MPVAVSEFQLLLTRLAVDLGVKAQRLLARMDRLDQREALAFLTAAYPELVTPYVTLAAQATVVYYTEQPVAPPPLGVPTFTPAVPDILAPREQLAASARWALMQPKPIPALQGSATRAVFNGSRDTIVHNANLEGASWARHASSNACGFCRMLATRGEVYTSKVAATRVVGRGVSLTSSDHRAIRMGLMTRDEALRRRSVYRNDRQAKRSGSSIGETRASIGRTRGNRPTGEKYHDHCHCIAVCVRLGDIYEPPPYVEQWDQDYIAASRESSDVKVIARLMEQASSSR